MRILRSVDIEEECRAALSGHLTAYCPPLPAEYTLPNVLVRQIGGTDESKIDSFVVTVDARAEDEATASETLRNAIGILKAAAEQQSTAIRYVSVNTSGSWGSDPVRPDLAMCSATLQITAHQEFVEV